MRHPPFGRNGASSEAIGETEWEMWPQSDRPQASDDTPAATVNRKMPRP